MDRLGVGRFSVSSAVPLSDWREDLRTSLGVDVRWLGRLVALEVRRRCGCGGLGEWAC